MKILKQRSKLNRDFRFKIDSLVLACEGANFAHTFEGTFVRVKRYEGRRYYEGTKVLNLRRFYLRPN